MTANLPAWMRLVGLNAGCALGVALLVTGILGVGPFVPTLLIALLYANAIGIPAALILPAPLACHGGPGWRQWAVLTGGCWSSGPAGRSERSLPCQVWWVTFTARVGRWRRPAGRARP